MQNKCKTIIENTENTGHSDTEKSSFLAAFFHEFWKG